MKAKAQAAFKFAAGVDVWEELPESVDDTTAYVTELLARDD